MGERSGDTQAELIAAAVAQLAGVDPPAAVAMAELLARRLLVPLEEVVAAIEAEAARTRRPPS